MFTLRIRIVDKKVFRKFRFASRKCKVGEACKAVANALGVDHRHYGLFLPISPKNAVGRWLRDDYPLDFYDLEDQEENNILQAIKKDERGAQETSFWEYIEFKKKNRPLKVWLKDGTFTTILIDDTLPASRVVQHIVEQVGLTSAAVDIKQLLMQESEEFIELLSMDMTLREQGFIGECRVGLLRLEEDNSDTNLSIRLLIDTHSGGILSPLSTPSEPRVSVATVNCGLFVRLPHCEGGVRVKKGKCTYSMADGVTASSSAANIRYQKSWNRRWAVLKKAKLAFYKSRMTTDLSGGSELIDSIPADEVVPLSEVVSVVSLPDSACHGAAAKLDERDRRLCFEVRARQHHHQGHTVTVTSYLMVAPTSEEKALFMDQLNLARAMFAVDTAFVLPPKKDTAAHSSNSTASTTNSAAPSTGTINSSTTTTTNNNTPTATTVTATPPKTGTVTVTATASAATPEPVRKKSKFPSTPPPPLSTPMDSSKPGPKPSTSVDTPASPRPAGPASASSAPSPTVATGASPSSGPAAHTESSVPAPQTATSRDDEVLIDLSAVTKVAFEDQHQPSPPQHDDTATQPAKSVSTPATYAAQTAAPPSTVTPTKVPKNAAADDGGDTTRAEPSDWVSSPKTIPRTSSSSRIVTRTSGTSAVSPLSTPAASASSSSSSSSSPSPSPSPSSPSASSTPPPPLATPVSPVSTEGDLQREQRLTAERQAEREREEKRAQEREREREAGKVRLLSSGLPDLAHRVSPRADSGSSLYLVRDAKARLRGATAAPTASTAASEKKAGTRRTTTTTVRTNPLRPRPGAEKSGEQKVDKVDKAEKADKVDKADTMAKQTAPVKDDKPVSPMATSPTPAQPSTLTPPPNTSRKFDGAGSPTTSSDKVSDQEDDESEDESFEDSTDKIHRGVDTTNEYTEFRLPAVGSPDCPAGLAFYIRKLSGNPSETDTTGVFRRHILDRIPSILEPFFDDSSVDQSATSSTNPIALIRRWFDAVLSRAAPSEPSAGADWPAAVRDGRRYALVLHYLFPYLVSPSAAGGPAGAAGAEERLRVVTAAAAVVGAPPLNPRDLSDGNAALHVAFVGALLTSCPATDAQTFDAERAALEALVRRAVQMLPDVPAFCTHFREEEGLVPRGAASGLPFARALLRWANERRSVKFPAREAVDNFGRDFRDYNTFLELAASIAPELVAAPVSPVDTETAVNPEWKAARVVRVADVVGVSSPFLTVDALLKSYFPTWFGLVGQLAYATCLSVTRDDVIALWRALWFLGRSLKIPVGPQHPWDAVVSELRGKIDGHPYRDALSLLAPVSTPSTAGQPQPPVALGDLLLGWVNHRLERSPFRAAAGGKGVVRNFHTDLRDGDVYVLLLHQLAPSFCEISALSLYEPEAEKRMQTVLDSSLKLGVPLFLDHPAQLLRANWRFHFLFVASLFLAAAKLETVSRELVAPLKTCAQFLNAELPLTHGQWQPSTVIGSVADGVTWVRLLARCFPRSPLVVDGLEAHVHASHATLTQVTENITLAWTAALSNREVELFLMVPSEDLGGRAQTMLKDLLPPAPLASARRDYAWAVVRGCVLAQSRLLANATISIASVRDVEAAVREWANQKTRANGTPPFSNLAADIRDSTKYAALLANLGCKATSGSNSLVTQVASEKDFVKRGEIVIESAYQKGCRRLITGADIAEADREQNLVFLLEIYRVFGPHTQ